MIKISGSRIFAIFGFSIIIIGLLVGMYQITFGTNSQVGRYLSTNKPWANVKEWNNIPSELYPTQSDVSYSSWEKWATEDQDVCDAEDIRMYYELGKENPKLRKFIQYAAKSPNGIDKADCYAMIDIQSEKREADDKIKFKQEVDKIIKEG